MKSKVELLRAKEREGRALLDMRPLDKEAYASWSESTREAIAGSLGASSERLRQLVQARRAISVRYEIDPSYHLTQVGANLRRELSVLRRCISELGDAPPPDAFRRPAKVAASLIEKTEAERPASSRRTRDAGARGTKLLILLHDAASVDRVTRSALESLDSSVIRPVDDGILAKILKGEGDVSRGIVVLSGSGDAGSSPPAARSLFALGVLAGRLGPERVCVLHPEGLRLPSAQSGILHVSLQDPDGWRTRIVQHFGSVE